ncbi:MAG: toll/interleukin-1 receptor domain-containing protein [Anaerolineae bacterium]|nr:toll/interleukin-1 receptor domain-containing protein [Anaerolineae bacterium]
MVIYAPSDSEIAKRIEADFGSQPEQDVILLVSPAANEDAQVRAALDQALDNNRRIIPVLVQAAPLPKSVEHLEAVDFTHGYNADLLRERLAEDDGIFHMKVHTSQVRSSNRRSGTVFALLAVLMFLMGLYLVGVLGVQAPADEYNYVETEIILTRDYYVDQALPRSTEDAANFQATVDSARPTLRPVLIATATAVAGE